MLARMPTAKTEGGGNAQALALRVLTPGHGWGCCSVPSFQAPLGFLFARRWRSVAVFGNGVGGQGALPLDCGGFQLAGLTGPAG